MGVDKNDYELIIIFMDGGISMHIGNKELRNQFIMAPVKTGYGTKDGEITNRHLTYYRRRAKYVGAIIPEPFFIDSSLKELPTQIGIDNDDKISGLQKLVTTIQNEGSKVIAHLNHPGRMANPNIPTNIFVSSSEQACENGGKTPRALTKDEIKNVINLYKNAAIRAEKSGFDMIELQFGHGYLVAQFLSPKVNMRDDEYGGTFENRSRFALEVFKSVKEAVTIPIIVRLSSTEMVDGGIEFNETKQLVQILEKEGIAAIHLSAGSVCSTPNWYYQHMSVEKGKIWGLAGKLKKSVNIPIILVGQINEFADVDYIKENKLADFIAIGRPMVADPDFVGKYLQIVDDLLRPCSACLDGCVGGVKAGKGLMCTINPLVGREEEVVEKAAISKKYAVVGGGLAGMQAAITLKERGHEVTLFEKEKLGGQFQYAFLPPKKISLKKAINYLKAKIEQEKVNVIQQEIMANDLIGKYDGVVLATGSKPFVPPIEGLSDFSWAEIIESNNLPNGKKVLIIGGGLIGIEIAETLVVNGNQVVIVEMLEEVARGMEMIGKKVALTTLQKHHTEIYLNTKVTKIENGNVFLQTSDKEFVLAGFDLIVVATGMKPNNLLKLELEGKIPYVLVGDAAQVGKETDAIQSAYFTAKEL